MRWLCPVVCLRHMGTAAHSVGWCRQGQVILRMVHCHIEAKTASKAVRADAVLQTTSTPRWLLAVWFNTRTRYCCAAGNVHSSSLGASDHLRASMLPLSCQTSTVHPAEIADAAHTLMQPLVVRMADGHKSSWLHLHWAHVWHTETCVVLAT